MATLQPQVPLNAIQSLVKQAKEKSGGDGLASIADIITKVMPHSSTNQICQATGLTKHYVDAARASTIGTSSLISGKPYRKKRSDAFDENSPEIKQLYDFFLVGGYTRFMLTPRQGKIFLVCCTGCRSPICGKRIASGTLPTRSCMLRIYTQKYVSMAATTRMQRKTRLQQRRKKVLPRGPILWFV